MLKVRTDGANIRLCRTTLRVIVPMGFAFAVAFCCLVSIGIAQPSTTPTIQRLGATFTSTATTFAIWSPESSQVELQLDGATHPTVKIPDAGGYTDVYAVTVPGNHHLKPYVFRVAGKNVRDPYGVMVDPASGRNIVIDLTQTEPASGWAPAPPLAQRTDAVIYEIHVRDFTITSTFPRSVMRSRPPTTSGAFVTSRR